MITHLKSLVRHLWLDAADTRRAIPPDLLGRLAQRVAASEQRHGGQIRICVESSLPIGYLWRLGRRNSMGALTRQRAVALFGELRVWDTEHNNGVLIYLLLAEHAIEILADRGLRPYVIPAQWQAMVARLAQAFRDRRYEDGLTEALEETSAVLMAHFAVQDANKRTQAQPNELPDKPLLL